MAELGQTLARIGTSTDPLRQEARRLIDQGNVEAGQAKLDAALDADEQAVAEAERVGTERRIAAARSARDLAVLARGSDVVKAVAYYQRATRLDPSDPQTWIDYGDAARAAGHSNDARTGFKEAERRARERADHLLVSKATYRQGDIAMAQGDLNAARAFYEASLAIIQPLATADPGNVDWQRALSVSHGSIGNVLRAQGNLASALDALKTSLAITERLAKTDPSNVDWQSDLSVSHNKIGDVLRAQGNLPAALEGFRASLAIRERLAKTDPGNAGWQRDLAASHGRIGDVQRAQGNLAAALDAYKASLAITQPLATADPGNTGRQRDLSVSYNKIGNVLV